MFTFFFLKGMFKIQAQNRDAWERREDRDTDVEILL